MADVPLSRTPNGKVPDIVYKTGNAPDWAYDYSGGYSAEVAKTNEELEADFNAAKEVVTTGMDIIQ
jgi:hypothetical protein